MTTANKTRPISVPITETEQSAFCQDEKELKTKALVDEFKVAVRWQQIPKEYLHLEPEALDERLYKLRTKLGKKLFILGHHYQRDDVIKYADVRGDSYLLSKQAAEKREADYIVFCGVHFMAETADILTSDKQKVILPNLAAGCSMADMAKADDVELAFEDLTSIFGKNSLIPVTYMNSAASIKALCGRNGGIVCTSSNVVKSFKWAFERGEKVLFLPDQHLGRNTRVKLGIKDDEEVVWNPFKALGGNSEESLKKAKVILWQGHCSVHTRFTPKQIEKAREKHPDVQVIVHPECPRETVEKADMNGSTELILKTISEAKSGSTWAVGTEISMVNRLAKENPDKTIFCLDNMVCPCATMYRIHPAYLLWVIEGLDRGEVLNQITVEKQDKSDALLALERMLEVAKNP